MMLRVVNGGLVRQPARTALVACGWPSREFSDFRGGRSKVVTASDAAALIRNGDTICMSGFVTQAVPETVAKALGERYANSGCPKDLTFVFYGVGDPKGKRGTNHFSQPGMLYRTIASHYGQSPDLHKFITQEGPDQIQAYSLPMGSIARMVRSAASGSPGHFTKVGLKTFVDPRNGGGKMNKKTVDDLVEVMEIDGQEYLRYKPLRINVAIIRATTADVNGNLTNERESVLPDIRVIATAARASGGIVIAQVERVAAANSLKMRDVKVPGALVDCVVQSEPEDHGMSFYTKYDPSWSGEVKLDTRGLEPMPLNMRKVIARRAAFKLKPDDIVNLGIGLPEGVAKIAKEENILDHITLTTEAGLFGGVGASGLDFGPAVNPSSMVDISSQFDFYDGGGLNVCFLGAAEVDRFGNVNVHKLDDAHITGPGGFIDISQSNHKVIFLGTFRKKGLKVDIGGPEGPFKIVKEGEIPMFKESVQEITFNAEHAIEHAQNVSYITERAVFRLTHEGIALREVAPGVDIKRDILDQMEFMPIVDYETIREMDPRLFREVKMKMDAEFFQTEGMYSKRFHYSPETNTLYIDMSGLVVQTEDDLSLVHHQNMAMLDQITDFGKNKVHACITYERSDINPALTDAIAKLFKTYDQKYYLSVVRMAGKQFYRQKMSHSLHLLSFDDVWNAFRADIPEGQPLPKNVFCEMLNKYYQVKLDAKTRTEIIGNLPYITRDDFDRIMSDVHEFLGRRFKSPLNTQETNE